MNKTELDRLKINEKILRDALEDALEGLEDMIGYVSDYFREKHKHDLYISDAREALDKTKETPNEPNT